MLTIHFESNNSPFYILCFFLSHWYIFVRFSILFMPCSFVLFSFSAVFSGLQEINFLRQAFNVAILFNIDLQKTRIMREIDDRVIKP